MLRLYHRIVRAVLCQIVESGAVLFTAQVGSYLKTVLAAILERRIVRFPLFIECIGIEKYFLRLNSTYVIAYETPRFGRHHFTVNAYSSNCTSRPLKKPKWVEKLYQKHQSIDLDTVILAINCSAAVSTLFDRELGISRSSCLRSMLSRPINFIWRFWAAVAASISTALYIVLQLLYKLAVCGSKVWTCIALTDMLSNTWKNIQIRCFQILYWPIFLNDTGLRSEVCVEYAEKAALRRHSLWSSVVVDVLLGNLVGFALWTHSETICKWISALADHFTDDVLRTGCVWLMGVPAGFKLNMELAGFLGIISLNAIQIWSTLSASASYFCSYAVKAAGLSGMFLGITIPAALFTDMVAIAAFHVSTLHRLMSLLYSLQLQALTALWRLFRGWKWNPLRQRLDSYEYSVEQHIVGSLLFTPLLLLLPTISVFYMFFTIVNLTISFFCVLIEVIVSIIHATPYTKILLWLVRSRRFPSGIWFDIVYSQNASVASSVDGPSGISSASKKRLVNQNIDAVKSGLLLSSLRSNFLTLGRVVLPHYRNICPGVNGSTIASSISGILMGKSISMTLAPEVPPKKPWMFISYKDYWRICYNAVLACMQP